MLNLIVVIIELWLYRRMFLFLWDTCWIFRDKFLYAHFKKINCKSKKRERKRKRKRENECGKMVIDELGEGYICVYVTSLSSLLWVWKNLKYRKGRNHWSGILGSLKWQRIKVDFAFHIRLSMHYGIYCLIYRTKVLVVCAWHLYLKHWGVGSNQTFPSHTLHCPLGYSSTFCFCRQLQTFRLSKNFHVSDRRICLCWLCKCCLLKYFFLRT